jgi:hypothetical protein
MGEARHALIVAASKYRDTRLPPLGAPGQDARKLREVLRNAEIGGFEVQLALNSSVQKLRLTLEAFFSKRARDDLLLLHFSGHGLKDDEGQLYLAAADTQVDYLRASALDTEWLRQLMTDSRSEKIAVFLDCCFGGAFATAMTHKVGVDVPGVQEHLSGAGRVVITASNAVQYAFEGGAMVGAPEASVFTQALVTGLRSGEADRNDDGKVTINELFEYLRDKVHENSPSQTPMKWDFGSEGDWEIASSRRPSIKLLSADLQTLIASPETVHRLAALTELGVLLASQNQRMAGSAELAVRQMATDDSDKVKAAAKHLLATLAVRARTTSTSVDDEPPVKVDDAPIGVLVEAKGPVETADPPDRPATLPDADKAEARRRAQLEIERGERIEAEAARLAAARAKAEAEAAKAARLVEDQARAEAAAAEATRRAAEKARLEAEARARRRKMAIGIGGGVVGVVLLAAIAWIGCVGRTCGPSHSPSGGSTANGSDGPVVDPPSGQIVFTSGAGSDYDIWSADPDGLALTRLLKAPDTQIDPSWSPDRTQIVYRDVKLGLRIVTSAGKPVPNPDFTHHGSDNNPAWAPDGKSIAFASDRSTPTLDIYKRYLASPDDPLITLSATGSKDWDPSWSPGSDRIAFATERDGSAAIYTMDANGDDETPLTTDDAIYDDPTWSHDGEWIAMTRKESPSAPKVVWVIRPDGTGARQVTHSEVGESDPTWSPDNKYLAFSRAGQIVVVNLDGDEIYAFGTGSGSSGWPDWR